VRGALSVCRSGVAGAAVLVVLAACGGESTGDSSGESTAAQSSATETPAASDQDDFCAQAGGIDERVDSALSDLGNDDASVPDVFRQLAEELRAIEPPEEIAADWETQADGLDRIADALPDIDFTDPDSLETLDEIDRELSTASANVTDYLRDECGL
jgi:hypothetical protein